MAGRLFNHMFQLTRRQKRSVLVCVDAFLLTISFILGMALRLDTFSFAIDPKAWITFGVVLPFTLLWLFHLGVYRTVVRHVSGDALRILIVGVTGSALLMLLLSQALGWFLPRSVPVIYCLLAVCLMGGARFTLRGIYRQGQSREKEPVLIYGAGSSGRQLRASLEYAGEYAPVAFVDDARELHKREIGGCRVYPPHCIKDLIERYGIRTVLLAMPSATRLQRKAILERLERFHLRVRTIPGIADIVSGRAQINEIREVSIEELLGRDLVEPDPRLLDANIRDKVVMVTGAGGSIGSELCRQIIRQKPRSLVLFELSEFALYQIEQELRSASASELLNVEIFSILGSILDRSHIHNTLSKFDVDTIFHAAAYKHVPLVEHNPVQGVRNNVFGTLSLAQAAVETGVKAFVLISTDKAVRPTNIMGASKRMAELICQALAAQGGETVFSIVRFGNVLGSSGSVIPLFRRQIEAGGPITVTHREITRYFMAIPEAAQLVIQAGAMGTGGDVFILEMGEPVKIADLAMRMSHLSGLRPIIIEPGQSIGGSGVADGDIEIRFTTLRPGEKLYEELLIDDCAKPTAHSRIFTAMEVMIEWSVLSRLLNQLEGACERGELLEIQEVFRLAQTGYVLQGEAPCQSNKVIWQESQSQICST